MCLVDQVLVSGLMGLKLDQMGKVGMLMTRKDLLRGSLALKYGYGRDWVFLVPCMGLEAIDMVEGGNMGLGP